MVKPNQKPLEIRLTEPVIFLKGPSTGLDFRGRPTVIQDGQPAMLRGLLTLRLAKATRIRVITVRLEAKAKTEWPEGIGPRRIDTFEEHQLLSEMTTFFNARKDPVRGSSARRASSVGPGVSAREGHDSDYSDDDSPLDDGADEVRGRGRHRGAVDGVPTPPRSASALPASHDGTRYHRDGFSRRPSIEHDVSNTASPRMSFADLTEDEATLTRRRGASPAYSAIDRNPAGPSGLGVGAGSTMYYRRSSASPMPFSRDSTLSPIVSATTSRAASDRTHSASTERGRETRRVANVGPTVDESMEWLPQSPAPAPEEQQTPEEEMDPLMAGIHRRLGSGFGAPPNRSILNVPHHGVRTTSTGEVRFADPTPPDSRDPENGEVEGNVPGPRDGRLPGMRMMDSPEDENGPHGEFGEGDGDGDDTADLAHPHMAAVHSISALSTAHNSPAPSRPTSIYEGRDSALPPSGLRNLAIDDESGPSDSSRRSSLLANHAGEVARRTSRGASTSSLHVGTDGHPDPHRVTGSPGPHSPSSPFASPRPRPPSLTEERGRKSHKFSLGAALRDLGQRVSSKSRSRQPSLSGSRPPSIHESPRPPLPHHASSTSTAMSRESGASHDGTLRNSSRRRSFTQDPDLIPPHGRGGAGRINMSRERRDMEALAQERSRQRTASPGGVDDRDRGDSHSRSRGRNKALKALGKFVDAGPGHKDKHHEEDEDMHNWKEFRKGTYNYPISFQIPANSPPTLHAEFGSVVYRLKATVVKVGALTPNLTEELEVTTIATPQEDDLEETENVLVERQWEDQMRYQIALSGKAFPIGGTIPLSIRLMPLAKCRLHRLTVAMEEKTDYYALGKKAVRHETPRKFVLFFAKQPEKKERIEPLLPILSEDVDAARKSPLADMARQAALNNPTEFSSFSEEDSRDAMYAQLMDPMGPWHLEKDLHVPDCTSKIKFTTKHERTNMSVGHWLKITLRVERGDDVALDKAGRRKQFDIIIETPIKILDCRVNPAYNSLPTYSAGNPTGAPHLASFCAVHGQARPGDHRTYDAMTHGLKPVTPGVGGMGMGLGGGYADFGPRPPREHKPVHKPSSEIAIDGAEGEDSLLERNLVFDRLVSGQETESGEAPPTYGEVLAGAAVDAGERGGKGRAGVRVASASASRSRSRIGSRGGD